ncbi:hypothetical protein, partial [Alicyclobacillus shizuokensis]|uniref:hypothetical protein n=1 Tax=Alicyclobacillus shizuokensis TaxID=392014 RepID=UPI001C3F3F0C
TCTLSSLSPMRFTPVQEGRCSTSLTDKPYFTPFIDAFSHIHGKYPDGNQVIDNWQDLHRVGFRPKTFCEFRNGRGV